MGSCSFQDFCDHFDAISMVRVAARLKQWHRCVGLGVAGNVAGHAPLPGTPALPSEHSGPWCAECRSAPSGVHLAQLIGRGIVV